MSGGAAVETFSRVGYLRENAWLDDDRLRELRSEADRVLELLVNASIANDRSSGRLDVRRRSDGSQVVRKIQPIRDLSLAFAQLATDARLTERIAPLLGDLPALMEDKLTYKQRLTDGAPPLATRSAEDGFHPHTDWAYHRAQGFPPSIVNAALCLDDCPPDSGPLRVWPGTHLDEVPHERVEDSHCVPVGWLEGKPSVDLVAPAGSLLLFHGSIVHCSEPNRTDRSRRVLIFSYYPVGVAIAPDARNGPTRLEESPYEWNYQRLKQSGAFRDRFRL